jgi:GTP pyrophosphokinase
MHRIAEYGIAAHWKYKEGKISGKQDESEQKLAWLRQALEWQKDADDSVEFLETLKMDLFDYQVFVFTPGGDVVELPADSTPLDFAFKIHTEVGIRCVGAKVNGKMVTIDHKLNNGDIVEIVTSANSSGPSIDWLKICKTSQARNKIRNWLRKAEKNSDVTRGKSNINNYIKKKGYDPVQVAKNAYILKAVAHAEIRHVDIGISAELFGGRRIHHVNTAEFGAIFAIFIGSKRRKARKIDHNDVPKPVGNAGIRHSVGIGAVALCARVHSARKNVKIT